MPINNRELDPSQKKDIIGENLFAIATGTTYGIFVAPYPCEISAVDIAAIGISGSPVWSLENNRFIAGVGTTGLLGLAATLAVQSFGTSGIQGFSLLAPGSTLIQLLAGDVLTIRTLGSNAAAAAAAVTVVVKKSQDTVSHFGVST